MAKKSIIGNKLLRTDFKDACVNHTNLGDDMASSAVIDKVYNTLVQKVLHSWYGQIIRRWRENNVKSNDKQAFRPVLKAGTAKSKKRKGSSEKESSTKPPKKAVTKVTPPSQQNDVGSEETLPPEDEIVDMYISSSAKTSSPNKK